ncbi:MAG: glycosyltransferase [Prevotella sp.]|nr:glycosyltransferase [Prevotella sp.]
MQQGSSLIFYSPYSFYFMIKVLIIHPCAKSRANGISSHCDTLYHLFKDDKDIVVLKPENYPIRNIKIFNGVFRFRKLLKAVKASKADIVHVHGYTTLQVGQALLAAVLCHKRIVYSPHWHPFCELRRPLVAKLFFYLTIAPLIRCFAAYSSFCRIFLSGRCSIAQIAG